MGITASSPSSAEEAPKRWVFDNGLLFYKESSGRVQDIEPVASAALDLGDDRSLSATFVLDSLTGATPNGAAPAPTPQTFAQPSGHGRKYTVAPGAAPLDHTFEDTRYALDLGYDFPLSEEAHLGAGIHGSQEYDYTSVGANTHYALDLNQKNTTLSAGLSFEYDLSEPVGHVPIPLTPMVNAVKTGGSEKSKNVKDILLGVTQVLDAQSLFQFNYSLSLSNGYDTDPYKILSVVDASAQPMSYIYEKRPGSRVKNAFYAEYKRLLPYGNVVDVSYRYFLDNWGIRAHTFAANYRWNLNDHQYLEPDGRFYMQSAADFYRPALYIGEEVSSASADPRLGSMKAGSGGLKYGQILGNGNEISLRVSYYKQFSSAVHVPEQAQASLSRFDLVPNLSAVYVTLGYRFDW